MHDAEMDLPTPESATASATAWAALDPALAALLASEPSVAAALARWGAALFRAGRAADAITVFRATLALAPGSAASWTNLAIAFDATGALEAAKACFLRSIAIRDDDADTWFLLGCVREKEGDLSGAERDLRRASTHDPRSAATWKRLGVLLRRRDDPSAAIEAFQKSLAENPTEAAVSANLGKLLYEHGRIDEARAAYSNAVANDPGNDHFARMLRRSTLTCDLISGALPSAAIAGIEAQSPLPDDERLALVEMASATLVRFGHDAAALRLAQWRAEQWPDDPRAHYLLASLLGADLPRSPDDYIVASFDAFADNFDAQLVDVLGYDVPEKLRALLSEVVEPGRSYDTLDIGCGTGLCGPLLRPIARTLTGLDLSPRMLAHARARGVYDLLVCEEVTAFLEKRSDSYDLVVGADVLIYFGDLRPVFAGAAHALRPGGIFAVSIERADVDDHRLGISGRFAHALSYVSRVANPFFETLVIRETTLRREGVDRVQGCMFVFRARVP